jgi:thioredoxin 1
VSVRVIHFTAPWCAPCKPVARALAEVAPAYPGVSFDAVDLDERPEEGARYGVLALPTVVIERDGEIAARLEGARKRRDYERALAEVVPAAELGG